MVEQHTNGGDRGGHELLARSCRDGPNYGPLIAYLAGVDDARVGFDDLSDRGLAERVSAEPLYRATDRGQQFCAAHGNEAGERVLGD